SGDGGRTWSRNGSFHPGNPDPLLFARRRGIGSQGEEQGIRIARMEAPVAAPGPAAVAAAVRPLEVGSGVDDVRPKGIDLESGERGVGAAEADPAVHRRPASAGVAAAE